MKINAHGGKATKVDIKQWNYQALTGRLSLSLTDGQGQAVATRVSIVSEDGHPVSAVNSATFDYPQMGRSYFYIDGNETFILPLGNYSIEALRGPMSQLVSTKAKVSKGKTIEAKLEISSLWDSKAAGYTSADFYVHLNGDGHHRATHKDALLLMQGENLDYLAPMCWNSWERKIDKSIVGKMTLDENRTIAPGQEVRSHFHGHIGLLNVKEPYSPWFFGPSNPALGDPNV